MDTHNIDIMAFRRHYARFFDLNGTHHAFHGTCSVTVETGLGITDQTDKLVSS